MKKSEKGVKSTKAAPSVVKASPAFTRELAREIVKNLNFFGKLTKSPFAKQDTQIKSEEHPVPEGSFPVLIDTSVLVDGRIVRIVSSGFLSGILIVPQFVLREIQHIADSSDGIRRAKGRRGLDAVNSLRAQRENGTAKCIITSEDVASTDEVDQKLIALSKRWKTRLLTVDYNLAQAARANGISVLNVNDLAHAFKVPIIAGELVHIKITHEGKERQQGVGYLEDGTMIVVEDTKNAVGQEVEAIITKIHQTSAGQLFFARLKV